MKKDFSNMTPKQIERLAIKNREQSQSALDEELNKRGIKKTDRSRQTYVDRSVDPSIIHSDHHTIFQEMKKKPYHE